MKKLFLIVFFTIFFNISSQANEYISSIFINKQEVTLKFCDNKIKNETKCDSSDQYFKEKTFTIVNGSLNVLCYNPFTKVATYRDKNSFLKKCWQYINGSKLEIKYNNNYPTYHYTTPYYTRFLSLFAFITLLIIFVKSSKFTELFFHTILFFSSDKNKVTKKLSNRSKKISNTNKINFNITRLISILILVLFFSTLLSPLIYFLWLYYPPDLSSITNQNLIWLGVSIIFIILLIFLLGPIKNFILYFFKKNNFLDNLKLKKSKNTKREIQTDKDPFQFFLLNFFKFFNIFFNYLKIKKINYAYLSVPIIFFLSFLLIQPNFSNLDFSFSSNNSPISNNFNSKQNIDSNLITIGSGSGFYINKNGNALTNNHVVEICKQLIAEVDGQEILFRVIGTDKQNDIAILKSNIKTKNFLKINKNGAKLGESIIAVGYPLSGIVGDSVKITKGIVSSLSGIDNNTGQIQIDAALQPGNSGGPVLNEKGELVGVASGGLNKLSMAREAKYIPENVNFAIAAPIVINILKNKKINFSSQSIFSSKYNNVELAEIGNDSTIQLLCKNTKVAYKRFKNDEKYSRVLLDLK